jgi:hypothetical protein
MESATGGVVPARRWRRVATGLPEYFIPLPAALEVPEWVRLRALLMDVAVKRSIEGIEDRLD